MSLNVELLRVHLIGFFFKEHIFEVDAPLDKLLRSMKESTGIYWISIIQSLIFLWFSEARITGFTIQIGLDLFL